MPEKLTPAREWAKQHDLGDCELGPDCGCCKELREEMIRIITAAVLEARLYELKRAEQHSTPMHANASGNGPDGCPRLCEGCRIERRFRDHFRALSAELEKLA